MTEVVTRISAVITSVNAMPMAPQFGHGGLSVPEKAPTLDLSTPHSAHRAEEEGLLMVPRVRTDRDSSARLVDELVGGTV